MNLHKKKIVFYSIDVRLRNSFNLKYFIDVIGKIQQKNFYRGGKYPTNNCVSNSSLAKRLSKKIVTKSVNLYLKLNNN